MTKPCRKSWLDTTDGQTVRLRPFPFPYRAALALCSDIDTCDRATFLAVHRRLNDPREGLGLPVADSFFGLGREPGQMAYFLPDGQTPGPDAPLIRQGLASGLIDALHSWGDFNFRPPQATLLSTVARCLTAELTQYGLKVPIWINHGDPCNHQNLPARLQPGYQGDNPCSPYYGGDYLPALGVAYYWWSELVTWPLSARKAWVSPRAWVRPAINALKNLVKNITGQSHRRRPAVHLKDLCIPVTLANGTPLLAFTRHLRGYREPTTRHTLHDSLAPAVLRTLIAQEGHLILYTHLGMPRLGQGEFLPPADYQALANLARHFQSGRIWVATTSQVLHHWRRTHFLPWRVFPEDGRLVIQFFPYTGPTLSPRELTADDLAGLCFYLPRPQATVFRLGNRDIAARAYGCDHTGRPVVGLDPPPPPDYTALEEFA